MRAHLLRASALFLSLSASAWSADAPAGGYVFELDGKPITPGVLSLEGTPD
jgi:hypothetical protein